MYFQAPTLSVRENDKGIKLFCRWEMLGQPLRQDIIVDQAGGVTIWVVRDPRGMVIGIGVSRPEPFILDKSSSSSAPGRGRSLTG